MMVDFRTCEGKQKNVITVIAAVSIQTRDIAYLDPLNLYRDVQVVRVGHGASQGGGLPRLNGQGTRVVRHLWVERTGVRTWRTPRNGGLRLRF